MGTVFYLAPELALGGAYDGRADLYALGVMLYELTTGRLPFAAEGPVAIISQHLHAPVVPPRARNPDIPPGLEALILHLMSKEPDDRPASAAEVLRALTQPGFLDREAAAARELSVLERIERGRMVGRERQMREATASWAHAVAGRGRMLLVSGEPGIGKTRLLRELMTHAEIGGGRALLGSCYAEGGVPYAPFAQILRRAHRDGARGHLDLPESVAADLVTLAPILRQHYPEAKPNPQLDDPRAEQQRLFESLVLLFSLLSERAPLLLALEDAHWADSGTLFLLRHLARRTRHQRVMLVATYREVELDQARPFHEVLLDLERERLAARLKLPRLDWGETKEMLAVLFDEAITPEFLEGIYRETEGNPFFIEEVCKALVESGKLTFADGRWDRPDIPELGIPQSVRVAIQSRVGALPAGCQELLRLAAVLGREFDFDTLLKAGDLDEEALLEALEEAERAQLIEDAGGEGGAAYAFVHGLFATTLVEGLRVLERRRLHRQAAAAIEAVRPEDYEALARHHSEAGNAERALEYLLLAADRARVLYAHSEAIEGYTRALDYLKEQGDWDRAARTQMVLGLVQYNAFDFEAARRAYDEGFALWQRAARTEEAPAAPALHAFRFAAGAPATLDPAHDPGDNLAIPMLFSGLVRLTVEAGVEPEVARRWELLDGGRRYLFHLRDDWRWSDGVPVTAGDFEYAWKRALDPATEAAYPELLYDIEGARAFNQGQHTDPSRVRVRALDNLTLLVQLEGPAGYFLHLLGQPTCRPVPRHVVEAYGDGWTEMANLVTNGPFRLAAWRPAESMLFTRNPAYPGRFRGNLQEARVALTSPGEWAAPLAGYEADDLDHLGLGNLPVTEQERVRQRHAREYGSVPGLVTAFVCFDAGRPPFQDPRVRRAFALATDRSKVVDVLGGGYQVPATGGFVPPEMPGHSAGIGLPYDPEGARGLLAEAGYPDGRDFPQVVGRTFNKGWFMCEHFLACWRENLDVEVELEQVEFARFGESLRTDPPHLVFSGWVADHLDPDSFLRVAVDAFRRLLPWPHAAYDELVERARRLMDQGERMKLYRQADTILMQEAYFVPTFYSRAHFLIKPWVKYPPSPLGYWSLQDFVIEPH
jgi:ABC-type oligopeptide transport system substrate-binding subunit